MGVQKSVDAIGLKFKRINASADGVNVIIAAIASTKILVIGYTLSVDVDGRIKFQDTTGTPIVHAEFFLAIDGVATYNGSLESPAFITAAGKGVNINNPAGTDTVGHITYVEIT